MPAEDARLSMPFRRKAGNSRETAFVPAYDKNANEQNEAGYAAVGMCCRKKGCEPNRHSERKSHCCGETVFRMLHHYQDMYAALIAAKMVLETWHDKARIRQ